MPLHITNTRQKLKEFDFRGLFIRELGWDNYKATLPVTVGEQTWILNAISEKCGFVAWHCAASNGQLMPDYLTRRKIESEVVKQSFEHIIIFTDHARSEQIWQWVLREPGKPAAYREHRFEQSQSGEALLQKLAWFYVSLDDAGKVTLPIISENVKSALNVERVTKRFYELFKKEHAGFLKLISGIAESTHREWYASLMLNRLMFVYFMQYKGFLDGDRDYLRNRLMKCQQQQGHNSFYSFYRYFLLRLFHEGLGSQQRSPELDALLGKIPYLNGGLFEKHAIEELYSDIQIPDAAFKVVFDYFDQYQWHLDERPLRNDNEINPDVLGYIFEKYTNQKQMGAYYTKEDITEYICKNTILPFLFDAAKPQCIIAFENQHGPIIWDLLKNNPDHYIYSAIRHGVDQVLPQDIAVGLHDVSQRTTWNRAAPTQYALPAETWWEVVTRRTRYQEVRAKLAEGTIHDINELITLNLDIRQFAQDVIENCEGPELLRAFWRAIEKVTVLDPTCGSGAFLFAALNILEPLYEACLGRMEAFVADADRSGEKPQSEKFTDFRTILAKVANHSNSRYFVFKSIILNNLFGVDIMEEATEICKLRLFLKLAAQVDPDTTKPNLGIEPLPDIDFNIRAGNTLVGYATEQEFDRSSNLASDQNLKSQIKTRIASLSQSFDKFRSKQITYGEQVTTTEKQELSHQLKMLNDELNKYLAVEYGKNPNNEQWLKSHQPFHWFVEFYAIMNNGGFDVVVGNPPYVEYSKVRRDYSIKHYKTESCGNLYAYVIERSFSVIRHNGRMGMIVPLSLTFSRDFTSLRSMLLDAKGLLQISSYDNIPDRLFTGAKESENTSKANQQRITIFTLHFSQSASYIQTTPILRWKASERWRLLGELPLAETTNLCSAQSFPKVGSSKMKMFLQQWESSPQRLSALLTKYSPYSLVIPKTAGYYIAAYPNEMDRTKQMTLYFNDKRSQDIAMVLLNSNAFFWFWRVYGDGFDVTTGVVGKCPIFSQVDNDFLQIANDLYSALSSCTVYKAYRGLDVPNVNFNKRMDLLWRADKWIIRNVAPNLGVSPDDFIWGKSNSFLKITVPKAENFPVGYSVATNDDEDDEDKVHDL